MGQGRMGQGRIGQAELKAEQVRVRAGQEQSKAGQGRQN